MNMDCRLSGMMMPTRNEDAKQGCPANSYEPMIPVVGMKSKDYI
jgi:hypothetical protein